MKSFIFGDWKLTAAPECGGNLASLYWKEHKVTRSFDRLEDWIEPKACYGFPILFPPNRVADGKFKLNGVEYSLPINEPIRSNHIHGIPMIREWQIGEITENSISMFWEYTPDDPCYANYPFDCVLKITYTFTDRTMLQELEIRNTGKLTMPCALGFHSAFTAPEKACVSGKGKRLLTRMENRFLPDGSEEDWCHGFAPNIWFSPKEITQYGLFRTDGKPLALLDYGNGLQVEYQPDEKFTWWMVWRPVDDPSYFCTEPMNIPTNCHNYSPEALPLLPPGKTIVYKSRLTIKQ